MSPLLCCIVTKSLLQISLPIGAIEGKESEMTPGRLIVRGTVLGTDDGCDSFFIAPMQHIMVTPFPAPLIVMAIVTLPEMSNLPYQHLPPLNFDNFFSGKILMFDCGSVIVAVDFHLLFPLTDWFEDNGDWLEDNGDGGQS
jgi:hypothetical protein